MAERRMFSKQIIFSDAFLDLPHSARSLYIALGMNADDDGFINGYRGIIRLMNCKESDFRELVEKKFLIEFPSGVVVIKHWRMNNYLRGDRYHSTAYESEKALIEYDSKGIYHIKKDGIPNIGIPLVDHNGETEVSIGKDSIGKDSIGECKQKKGHFVPPTLEEVQDQIIKMKYVYVSAERFISFYASKGWMVGKSKMVDWKQALAGWEARDRKDAIEKSAVTPAPKTQFHQFEQRPSSDYDAFIKMVEGGSQ